MLRKFSLAVPLLFGLAGCNIINPGEVTPTYVHVDSFAMRSTAGLGSSSHKITHVYAFLDNAPVGIFDLPATFPVIISKVGTLKLIPGIDFNGLTGFEQPYPFYTADTSVLTPAPGTTVMRLPTTGYATNAKQYFAGDFENGSNLFSRLPVGNDTALITTTAPGTVFEGAASGAFYLIQGKDSAIAISVTNGLIIPPSKDAFIELDYKGTMSLTVGMTSTLDGGGDVYREYLVALRPRTTWGKVYIGITDFVGTHQGIGYHILLGTRKDPSQAEGSVFVDNVKIVSF